MMRNSVNVRDETAGFNDSPGYFPGLGRKGCGGEEWAFLNLACHWELGMACRSLPSAILLWLQAWRKA
jgi:hypothetical protein